MRGRPAPGRPRDAGPLRRLERARSERPGTAVEHRRPREQRHPGDQGDHGDPEGHHREQRRVQPRRLGQGDRSRRDEQRHGDHEDDQQPHRTPTPCGAGPAPGRPAPSGSGDQRDMLLRTASPVEHPFGGGRITIEWLRPSWTPTPQVRESDAPRTRSVVGGERAGDRRRVQALRRRASARRHELHGPAGRALRVRRRQRRGQDHDDADRPRGARGRRRRGPHRRSSGRRRAAQADRLHARGAGPLPADAGRASSCATSPELHGLSAADARRATERWTERLGVAGRLGDEVQKLSLGNQQRVQLAAALVHDPDVLVLDEPFSGLDPVAVDVMSEVLRERCAAGAPAVFSSHQLDLVERLCDRVGIVRDGSLVAEGTVEGLRGGRGADVVVDAPEAAAGLGGPGPRGRRRARGGRPPRRHPRPRRRRPAAAGGGAGDRAGARVRAPAHHAHRAVPPRRRGRPRHRRTAAPLRRSERVA